MRPKPEFFTRDDMRDKIRSQLKYEITHPDDWYSKTDKSRMERNRDVIVIHPECPYASSTGRVSEHRYIWWLHHKNDPPLEYGDVIHHIDGNHKNNDISNLLRISDKEHRIIHGFTISAAKSKNKLTTGL